MIKSQDHNNLKGGRETRTKKGHITKKKRIAMTAPKEAVITDPINSNQIDTPAVVRHLTDLTKTASFTAAMKISEARGAPSDLPIISQSPLLSTARYIIIPMSKNDLILDVQDRLKDPSTYLFDALRAQLVVHLLLSRKME